MPAALQATEIPSQVDDWTMTGKPTNSSSNSTCFPNETCIVTVTYGEPNRILKIRGDYRRATDALFATKIQGLGWESEKNACASTLTPEMPSTCSASTAPCFF